MILKCGARQPVQSTQQNRQMQPIGARFAVRAGNVGQYSPFVHVALPEELGDDAWSGVLIALAEPVEDAPDAAALASEVVESVVIAMLGADADNAIPLLQQAFANANTWLYAENAKRGMQRKVALGLSCLLLIGDDLFVAQLPPGQVLIRQDAELFAFPPLESWSPSFQPDRTYELPNPLGLRAQTEPQIFYTRAERGDQVFALSSSVARHIPNVQEALCSAGILDETVDVLLSVARGLGVASGYGAVVEIPQQRRSGWWRGREREVVPEKDRPTLAADDHLSSIADGWTTEPVLRTQIENSPVFPLDQDAPKVQTEETEPGALSWLGTSRPGHSGRGRAMPENSLGDTEIDGLESSLAPASQPALAMTASSHRGPNTPDVMPFQDSVGILGAVSRFLGNRRVRRAPH
jgi:hypothetical protein